MERKRKLLRWVLSLGVVLFMLITNAEKADAATCMHKTATQKSSPTCTRAGYERVYCSKCNTQFTYKTLPALGHNKVTVTLRGATCTQTGAYCLRCTRCNATDPTFNIPALGHNLSTSTTKSATCTAIGTSTTKCSRCSYSYTTSINKLGHNYGAINCTQDKCTRCGNIRAGGVGHVKTSRVDSNPTCSQTGIRTYYCALCNIGMGSDTIPKTAHTTAIKYTSATCEEAGYKITYCLNCNAEVSRSSNEAPKGHSFTKRVSCDKAYACSYCNKIDPNGKPLGHAYVGGDCETGGICSYCSQQEVKKGYHSWDPSKKACQKSTCLVCGAEREARTEHTYTRMVSCTEPMACTYCGTPGPHSTIPGHLLSDPNCMEDRHCTRLLCKYVMANSKSGHARDESRGTRYNPNTCDANNHEANCKFCHQWYLEKHNANLVTLAKLDQHVMACHSCGDGDCNHALGDPEPCQYVSRYYSFSWTQGDAYIMAVRTCTICKATRIDINALGTPHPLVSFADLIKNAGYELVISGVDELFSFGAKKGVVSKFPHVLAFQTGLSIANDGVEMYFEKPLRDVEANSLVSYIRAASDIFYEYPKGSDKQKIDFMKFDYSAPIYEESVSRVILSPSLLWSK